MTKSLRKAFDLMFRAKYCVIWNANVGRREKKNGKSENVNMEVNGKQ